MWNSSAPRATSLTEIVAEVGQMGLFVNTVTASTSEQAVSLREISSSADQMDKATQQNAAMVEETTAATQSLSRETETLADMVARFKVRGGQPVTARTQSAALRSVATAMAAPAPAHRPAPEGHPAQRRQHGRRRQPGQLGRVLIGRLFTERRACA